MLAMVSFRMFSVGNPSKLVWFLVVVTNPTVC